MEVLFKININGLITEVEEHAINELPFPNPTSNVLNIKLDNKEKTVPIQ